MAVKQSPGKKFINFTLIKSCFFFYLFILLGRMTSDIFNLKKQFVIYGAHHNNKVNVAIHMVFVPTILWTGKNSLWDAYFFCLNWLFLEALVFASNTGPLLDVKGTIFEFLSPFGPNLAFFVVVFYLIYYAILDPIAAVKKKKKKELFFKK